MNRFTLMVVFGLSSILLALSIWSTKNYACSSAKFDSSLAASALSLDNNFNSTQFGGIKCIPSYAAPNFWPGVGALKVAKNRGLIKDSSQCKSILQKGGDEVGRTYGLPKFITNIPVDCACNLVFEDPKELYDYETAIVVIENAGDNGNPDLMARYRLLCGNRGDGVVSLYPGAVPGDGHMWKLHRQRKGHYGYVVENIGNNGNVEQMRKYRLMAGNRGNGVVSLYPDAVPGAGHTWLIIREADGRYLIENAGDNGNQQQMNKYKVMAGNRGDGVVSLFPPVVPGRGDLWYIHIISGE